MPCLKNCDDYKCCLVRQYIATQTWICFSKTLSQSKTFNGLLMRNGHKVGSKTWVLQVVVITIQQKHMKPIWNNNFLNGSSSADEDESFCSGIVVKMLHKERSRERLLGISNLSKSAFQDLILGEQLEPEKIMAMATNAWKEWYCAAKVYFSLDWNQILNQILQFALTLSTHEPSWGNYDVRR